jgi:hypothetical protein
MVNGRSSTIRGDAGETTVALAYRNAPAVAKTRSARAMGKVRKA